MRPAKNDTWIGHPSADSTNEDEDVTVVDRSDPAAHGVHVVSDDTDRTILSRGMVEELRRRLREAEAREASGVRRRPSEPTVEARGPDRLPRLPEAAPELREANDPLADLEIEVEAPTTQAELDARAAAPNLEVALAPNSDSNFYAGFDDTNPDGVFVATYDGLDLAVGTRVNATVLLPAGYSFRVAATVEWVRTPEVAEPGLAPGVGLALRDLEPHAHRLIRSFVRHRSPLFYLG